MGKYRKILRHIYFFVIKRHSSDRSIQAIFGRLHTQSPGRLHSNILWSIVIVQYSR